MTRPSRRTTIILIAIACGLLIGAVITGLLHLTASSIILAMAGVVVLLYALFRRFGRPGDFGRSGWTGM